VTKLNKWFTGYFYNGYLKQLRTSFIRNEELFRDVKMWYPMQTTIGVKDGKKETKLSPIFDNYILFNFEEESLIWTDILRRTPVIRFLKDGTGELVPLTEPEVEHLKYLELQVEVINYSYLIQQPVIVTGGPFKGLTGFCRSIIKGKNVARVYISLFNVAEREVEINLEYLDIYEGGNYE
jgi:transcription antitermination factor NusG